MKRLVMVCITAFFVAALAFAGGGGEAASGDGDPERAAAMESSSGVRGFEFGDHVIRKVRNGEELVIRVVHQDVSLEFSQVIGSGVVQAGEDLGVDVEFTGSTAEQAIEDMVAIIETLITRRVDGLAIANVSPEALNPMIARAMAAGIPTITYGTPAPGSTDLAFIGQDLVASGEAQADIIAEALGEEGDVLIISVSVSAQWSIDRENGVRAGIAKYPNMNVVDIIETGTEDQQVYAAIENAIRANPNLRAIATLDAVTTPVTGRILSRSNFDLVHVGHDLQTETLANIKNGATYAALSQNPYLQGYTAVEMLYNFIMEGTLPSDVDTGVLRVDAGNVQEFLDRLDAGEPIG